MEISNAKIIITGGASGIGQFLAVNLLDRVEKVFILDNNEKLLSEIVPHQNLVVKKCDITNYEEVQQVVTAIFLEHGGANVLINNAGIIHSELMVNMLARPDRKHKLENWSRVVNVNLNAVFNVTSHVVDHMVTKK